MKLTKGCSSTMKALSEKRKNKRYQCHVPVDSKQGSSFDASQTIDISRDGIGFISPHVIPLNEKIAVEIALTPDSDPVLVLGMVKWVRKITDSDQYRIGMSFLEVLSGSPRRLGKYFQADHALSPEI